MFLPVLLVRDFGLWGYIIFAVPNVLGAAAMGWVLNSESSRRVAERHRMACAAFSLVTIAFQLYFFAVLRGPLSELGGGPTRRWQEFPVLLALAVVSVLAVSGPRAAGVVIWTISAALLGVVLWRLGPPELPSPGALPAADLLFLAPVCAFGFLLCPYLDLTFHRARQAAGKAGPLAFGFGFGVLFFAMILGTLLYFQPALSWMRAPAVTDKIAFVAIVAHILLQLTVTCVYHAESFDVAFRRLRSARVWGVVVAAGLVIVALLAVRLPVLDTDLSPREVMYRLFMSFYGLLFPAYVWLCMIPTRGQREIALPNSRKLAVFAAACLVAAPFYWMGFIERQGVWLAPGLGVVLLARLFVRSAESASSPAGGG